MTFYLISDNHDTLVGMRLAGIDGVVVEGKEQLKKTLETVAEDENVGIILITEKLVPLAKEQINDIKLNRSRPLILEVPDRHGSKGGSSIVNYIRDAIGVKL